MSTGLGRLGGRERRLAAAQRAFATLTPAQRRVLVLRYVDGVEPAAIAAVLRMPEDEVDALLATARSGLLDGTVREPSQAVRRAALAGAAAALALTFLPDVALDTTRSPVTAAPAPGGVTHVVDGEALIPALRAGYGVGSGAAASGVDALGAGGTGAVVPEQRSPRTPGARCAKLCLPTGPRSGDALLITVPDPVDKAVGHNEVELRQEHVPICSTVPVHTAGGVAKCVPGST